jgi:hypothetical protein
LSIANPLPEDVGTLSPNVDLTAKNLSVQITGTPGGSALRFFYLAAFPPDGDNAFSTACTVLSNSSSCSIPLDFNIPANSVISIRSSVLAGNANPNSDAMFSWTAK